MADDLWGSVVAWLDEAVAQIFGVRPADDHWGWVRVLEAWVVALVVHASCYNAGDMSVCVHGGSEGAHKGGSAQDGLLEGGS